MKKKLPIARMSELIQKSGELNHEVLAKSLSTISLETVENLQDAFWAGVIEATKCIADDTTPSFEKYFKDNYDHNI